MDIIEFAEAHAYPLYPVQRIILKLIYGLPLDTFNLERIRLKWQSDDTRQMTEQEYVDYLLREGRLKGWAEGQQHRDVMVAMGRRSGKNHLQVLLAAYEAHRAIERNGEWNGAMMSSASAILIGCNRDLARFLMDGIHDLVEDSPVLADRAANRQQYMMSFQTDADIEKDGPWKGSRRQAQASIQIGVRPALVSALRGQNMYAACLDEYAYFPKASQEEVHRAILPALTVLEGPLFVFSTPAREPGMFRRLYREPGLRIQIPTWEANPSFSGDSLRQHRETVGAIQFDVEFGAKFMETVPLDLDDDVHAMLVEIAAERQVRVEDFLYEVLDAHMREIVDGGGGGI